MVSLLVIVGLVMLCPSTAWAFGPVTHVDLGLEVIGRALEAGLTVAPLLAAWTREFLQGTIGPDREVAKNLAPYARHSHNWDRTFQQLAAARDEGERAFFLGCLCHLAADVIAHNYFVPLKIVESHRARFAGHLYWEMRLDARAHRDGRSASLRALGIDTREYRRFLATVVPGNLLGPRFNVRTTGLAMRVQRALAFLEFSAYVDRESRLDLAEADARDVRHLAITAQLSCLKLLEASPLARMDARGLEALDEALRIRKHLRALVRRQGEPNPEAARQVTSARQAFRRSVAWIEEPAPGAPPMRERLPQAG